MDFTILADVIVVVHTLYVGIVVFSVPLIIVGTFRGWKWVHNLWFRVAHLLMIGIVAVESVLGIQCPLTVWEYALRRGKDGTYSDDQGFIAYWLDRILFWHFPPWVFMTIYILFALLVISLLFFVPVNRPKFTTPR